MGAFKPDAVVRVGSILVGGCIKALPEGLRSFSVFPVEIRRGCSYVRLNTTKEVGELIKALKEATEFIVSHFLSPNSQGEPFSRKIGDLTVVFDPSSKTIRMGNLRVELDEVRGLISALEQLLRERESAAREPPPNLGEGEEVLPGLYVDYMINDDGFDVITRFAMARGFDAIDLGCDVYDFVRSLREALSGSDGSRCNWCSVQVAVANGSVVVRWGDAEIALTKKEAEKLADYLEALQQKVEEEVAEMRGPEYEYDYEYR